MKRSKRILFGVLLCTGLLAGASAYGAAPSTPAAATQAFAHANQLAAKGDSAAAEKIYRSLIARYPKAPEPYNNLATLYARKGELEKARKLLEKAMRTRATYSTIYDNLSAVYVALARNSYAKALRVNEKADGTKLQALAKLTALPKKPVVASAATGAKAGKPAAAKLASAKPQPAAGKPAAAPSPAKVAVAAAGGPVAAKGGAPVPAAATTVATAKRVAAKPSPPGSAPAVAGSPIKAALQRWAKAWSEQDVAAYLAAYAPDFHPETTRSRAAWEAQRKARLKHPQSISVTLDGIKIAHHGPDRATVRFIQYYVAPHYRDKTLKELRMRRIDGKWLIERELNLKVWRGQ